MSKYTHDEFISIMNKIIKTNKLQSNIDKALADMSENIRDDSPRYFADAMALGRDYYITDLCRALDKMFDSEDTIEWYVNEIVFGLSANSEIYFKDKIYRVTSDPETIWAVVEGEYL